MVMPPINTIVVHTLLLPPERQDATVREQAQRLLAKAWQPVEQAMEGRDYLIGDFSAADTMLGHACIMSKRLGIVNDENYPNLSAYADRLLARPACAKAFAA
jgi:glutathione S-transferase